MSFGSSRMLAATRVWISWNATSMFFSGSNSTETRARPCSAVEVKQGLKEGERLVTEGANALRDGVPVKDIDATPKTEKAPAALPAPGSPKASAAGAQEKSP